MNRRHFLAAGTGLALSSLQAACATPQSTGMIAPLPDAALGLESAAMEAWIYGIMLIENAASRTEALKKVAPNTLLHNYELTSVKTQFVTTPNNDTLYSRAWIDLAAGPVTLDMPGTGKRYISYAFMDMYGNNFAILGSRTTGGDAQRITLVGPEQSTIDPLALRSPTRWVWLLIRTLVDGEADLRAANAVQNAVRLTGPSRPVPPPVATRDAPWKDYFGAVQSLLSENAPPVSDIAFFERVAAIGLGRDGPVQRPPVTSSDAAQIESGIAKARAAITGRRSGQIRNNWIYPKSTLGDFGQDYLYRGQVAIGGLAALKPVEAMYMRPVSPDGAAVLPSATPYLLRFEKSELPPVDAFWSLTAYERTPAGQFYFFDNPVNRYAIGDRTPGLKYGADGSLEILISRTDPGGARTSNWLPAPPAGPLSLSLRTYLPKAELLDGQYAVPSLQKA